MGKVVYIDVDDTLVRETSGKRIPMPRSVALVRRLHENGIELYCWSRGGADYARSTASELGLLDCFRAFLPKPMILIDDQPIAEWAHLSVIHPAEADAASIVERLGR